MLLAVNRACCRYALGTRMCIAFQRLSLSTSGTLSGQQSEVEQSTPDNTDTSSTHRNLPLMTSRPLAHLPLHAKPKQVWLETLSTSEDEKLGIVDLHPDIFATFPRIDILWYNIYWQRLYRHVDYRHVKNRAEMRGGGRKPWPQKGTGRARQGSIRAPQFIRGGKTYGPRGPTSYFFMIPKYMRILGLRAALSVKLAQDNLHIVDSLDMPTDDPEFLKDLVESRDWGLSVLFVDDTDIAPKNIALATDKIKPYNIMPVYGLNVYSMLKHETVVLTLAALERIEERLLHQMHSVEFREIPFQTVKQQGTNC